VTPTNIPATEIVAKDESAIRSLDAERADTVRRAVNTILQQAESPKPTITKEEQDARKSLKEDNTIMILPADQGNSDFTVTNSAHSASTQHPS